MAPAVPERPVRFAAVGWSKYNEVRSIEVGAIEEIEKFGAKLQAQPLMKGYVFQNGEIPRREAWADERVSSEIAVESAGGGRGYERAGVEPLRRLAENGGSSKTWIYERSHGIPCVAIVRRVVAELRSEWEAGL